MSNKIRAKSQHPGFQLAYTTTGGPAIIEWKEVKTAAVKYGDSVVIDPNDGKVSIGLAASGTLYGVAAAGGAIGGKIPIWVGTETNVFMGRPNADATGIDIPLNCDIIGATGAQLLNIGADAKEVVRILGYVPTDDATDDTNHPRVFFTIIRSSYDGRVAAK